MLSKNHRYRVLFVCSRNKLRSRTATEIWKNSSHIDVRGRGTASSARRRITADDVRWAEAIVVMEKRHAAQIRERFASELGDTPVHVLEIPDDYDFMQPELVEILKYAVPAVLGVDLMATPEAADTYYVEPGEPYDTIVGTDVVLRPMRPEPHDFRMMVQWFGRDEVLAWYGGESHRYSYDDVVAKYGPRCGDQAVRATIIEYREASVGYLQYYPVDDPTEYELDAQPGEYWALDLFIGEPHLWGRGIGTAAIRLLQRYLAEQGVDKMVIDPQVMNARAIRAYENVGFCHDGLLETHEEHDGERRDCVRMVWKTS